MDLSKLIASGYTAMDILESIYKKKPGKLGKIKNLISYGYAPSTILHYLSGDKKNKEEQYMTSEERMFAQDESRRTKFGKLLGGLTGGIAGIAGLIASQGGEEPESEIASKEQMKTEQGVPVGEKFKEYLSQLPEEASTKDQGLGDELIRTKSRQSSVETNFPELAQTTQKFLDKGMSPEQAYDTLKRSKLYSGIVKRYEESEGEPYLENIKRKQTSKPTMIDRQKLMQAVSELRKYMQ